MTMSHLKEFTERVETERIITLDRESNRVLQLSKPTNYQDSTKDPQTYNRNEDGDKELKELRKKMEDTERDIKGLEVRNPIPNRVQPAKYCSYCQMNNHTDRECGRKPSPGTCFDCRRPGCTIGHPNCIGRRNQSR